MSSNYPNGFAHGVTIRGMPLQQLYSGEVFWVNNSSVLAKGGVGGSDGNDGTYRRPFSTLDYAIGKCTVNRGDIIVIMPGYTQTITLATEILLDVAGIAIIGLGGGSLRPTITFGTNATANIPITAANVSLGNVLFLSDKTDVVSAFTVTGTATPKDFTLGNCEFRDTSASKGFIKCVTGNATANCLDGFNFINNRVWGLDATAATTALSFLKASDRVTLANNQITMPALDDTPTLATFSTFDYADIAIYGNRVWRPSTGTTGSLFTGSGTLTGLVYDNYSHHLDGTAGLLAETGTTLGFIENYCMITGAADKSAKLNPVAV